MTFNQTINNMYLDYVNNFLTVAKFAEHYQISELLATAIINEGKNNNK